MIARIVIILRPVCVAATIALAVILILCFWDWQVVTWETFWKLFFSYIVLMSAYTLIYFIDDPRRITGG
jgi:hypothetical protein